MENKDPTVGSSISTDKNPQTDKKFVTRHV